MVILRVSVIALSALLAGCASPAPIVPHVGRDAPMQNVFRASQYTFTTDFPLQRNDPLVQELVELRERIEATLGIPMGHEPIGVVIFESQQRYNEFLRLNYPDLPFRRAFFVQQGGNELSVFACRGDRLIDDLRHEATHAVLHTVVPRMPLWLDEGIAEYFETSRHAAGLNPVHALRLREQYQSGWRPNSLELQKLNELRSMTAAQYRESWLWVHFCLHHSEQTREALREHLKALKSGQPDSLLVRLEQTTPDYRSKVAEHLLAQ